MLAAIEDTCSKHCPVKMYPLKTKTKFRWMKTLLKAFLLKYLKHFFIVLAPIIPTRN